MEIEINPECKLKKEKSNINLNENDNEINKNNDISTTKEDESYITDEVIQYCSSPKSGLVSIDNSNNSNNNIFSTLSIEKNDIRNTVTMSIAMIKKEINLKEIEKQTYKSNSFIKKEEDENENNYYKNKNIHYSNSNKISIDYEKDNKSKSIFNEKKKEGKNNKIRNYIRNINNKREKEKIYIHENSNTPINALGRTKYNSLSIEQIKTPIKKKISKAKKKKKYRKSNDNNEENKEKEKDIKVKEKRKSSMCIENKKKGKKKKKKKHNLSQEKKIQKDEKSLNVIILDFSSSYNSDDSDKNDSDSNNNTFEEKMIKEKENEINKNEKFNKIDDDIFLTKRQTTIIAKDINDFKKRKDFLSERKFIIPKTKNSCFVGSKMSQTKIIPKLTKRKFTSNNLVTVNNKIMNSKTKPIINQFNKPNKEKDKKEKKRKECLRIYTSKNLIKNLYEKEDDKTNKLFNTINKNNRNDKKFKNKQQKDNSFNSCKDLNKKYKPMMSHNLDNNKCYKIKNNELNFQNNSNKYLPINCLNNTPQSKVKEKTSYNSNRNLTKITINPITGENKDIHLVFDGKQETIINYTNQEMVDDENEYMVECLKVLLKLKMEEQPRCKQKVNFNFPNEDKNKKIALFDLDETLVHCTKDGKGLNGDTVNIKLPTNKIVPVGLNIRSHWQEALDLIKKHYNIVVYTASHQSYADGVLNYLDKENKYFHYRLYRNHCVQCDVDGIKFYVKDLDTLNKYYNLKDVVLIDNSVLSFAYHLNNGIPIVPFIEQKDDTQLLMLAYYLLSIASFDDLTQENKKHINIEHYLLMAKKLSNEESENDIEEDNNYDNKNINNKEKEVNINDNKENKSNKDNNIVNHEEIKNENLNDRKNKNIEKKKSLRESKKLLIKNSEKALKIAEDMKKNIGDIYKTNYNEKE